MNTSHISPHVKPIAEPLHVITAVFNPDRFRTRYMHYRTFEDHMRASGVVLHTVELAFGDRAFEVTDGANPLHIQLRTRHEMWYKENLQNIVVRRLPSDCNYFAFIDADFHMTRPDWAYEALHLMQRYPVIQLFSSYSTLRCDFRYENVMPSFMRAWHDGKRPAPDGNGWLGATGGAWAMTRKAYDTLGGLLDSEIVGSADWHMIFALVGIEDPYVRKNMVSPGYCAALRQWAARAKLLNARIGCLNNHAIHYYHGPVCQRGYDSRWQIMTRHNFDPFTDLVRDSQGLWQFAGNKPEMENEIIAYMEGRGDDVAPPTPCPPKPDVNPCCPPYTIAK
jgi:hypothetical protein